MELEERPDPEELLAAVQQEEQSRNRGKLKIFFGFAAGVGKTYAMLEAAHQRKAEGVDVVVGYVETHGRKETEALLRGLEVIPRRKVPYRNVVLEEMDLDAILARRPQLVLVDELPHTNAPGSRHVKRYQDVEELLAAGIHVYTTLNVQHLESVNDIVAQITGVRVQETVPDRVFDQADEVELIDLPPEELLQRLKEGKVYIPEQAERAMRQFFRPGNLIALRELALRRTAQQVDREMRAYMVTHGIPGPWPAGERVLVCVGPTPMAERLVRTARRLAAHLDAEWIALYVETPRDRARPQAERDLVHRALRLAEELGGRAITVTGLDVADEVVHYARAHNVTKIVIGKSVGPRWKDFVSGSLVERVIRQSGGVDVHVISSPAAARGRWRWRRGTPTGAQWRHLAAAAGAVAAVTGTGVVIAPYIQPVNLVMFYLLAVVLAGMWWGRTPAILASVLGVLAFDFFFVPPRLSFAVSDAEYLITFAALLVVAATVGTLTGRLRDQANLSRRRELEQAALYDLTRMLVAARGIEEITLTLVRHMRERFRRQVAVLLPEAGRLRVRAGSVGFRLDEKEMAAATWTFTHGEPSGRGENTLPGVRARYLPLKTGRGVVGVLAVAPAGEKEPPLTPDQRHILEAITAQAAVAIERARLADEARRAQLAAETERLHATLLNSISHDLRTPLASIIGALTTLTGQGTQLDKATRNELLETAREEAERLNRLVSNLLDMTRLESGRLKLATDWCDLEDVVTTALEQVGTQLKDRPVQVDVAPDLPLLRVDHALIAQVLANLLDNAVKYSPPGSPVEVSLYRQGDEVHVRVADRGYGIPEEHRQRIFDKFYRVEQPGQPAGTGLGLAICKGIVEAHGGRIWSEPRPGGGTVVTFTLPVAAGAQSGGSALGQEAR